ncbi:MAG: hypothetical protein ACI9DM_000702 [Cyclobacteriaceae bacterium]|jgi:hypothetical protein
MQEKLLHYIWKTRSFQQTDLQTTDGNTINIVFPGYHNHDAGPDFSESSILIDKVRWSGSVEIHIKSSDWLRHKHQVDKAYENVVLHVVWEADKTIYYQDGKSIPTLALKHLVNPELLKKYQLLSEQHLSDIPCHQLLHKSKPIDRLNMVEKAGTERLSHKADHVLNMLKSCNQDWEEVSYRLLFAAYGMKVNKQTFAELAARTPFKLVRKYHKDSSTLQAMLYGQAGLLPINSTDKWVNELIDIYRFIQHKHNLDTSISRIQWKFSKMRPSNFPTIRLAQLSSFLEKHNSIFELLTQTESYQEISKIMGQPVPHYWQSHYDFDKTSKQASLNCIGTQFQLHLTINAFTPVLAAASKYFGRPDYLDRAMIWLELADAEQNKITKKYSSFEFPRENALHSQGLLELYSSYCQHKKCLSCNIGASILSS